MRRVISGKNGRRLAAYILALALTLALAAPAAASAESLPGRGAAWADMEYVHYDPAAFYDQVDRLTELASGEDAQAVTDLFERLYDEVLLMWTYGSIASVRYSADVTDAYWAREDQYAERVGNEAADALCTACNAVMNGPCADAFRARVGEKAAQYYAAYVPATARERELADREAELTARYYEITDGDDGVTYDYGGQAWTEEMLYGEQGEALYDRDQGGYWQVSDGLDLALNAKLGPIFLELVQIRAELAGIWGYDSYSDAAYERVYGRDYGPDEAQLLCDAVKSFSGAYFDGLYSSDLWYMAGQVSPVLSQTRQVAMLGRYAGRIDPSLRQAWQFMTRLGLYELTDEPSSMDSGYTTSLYAYDSPFIYNRLYGNCYDLTDLAHEFGHFADEYLHPPEDPVVSAGSYDLFEIHSTGLEALLTGFYDEIYTDGAGVAKFIVLGSLLESVVNGCIHDEFQRRVYARPDMTLDQVNALYIQVCGEYGMDADQAAYGWQYIAHNFTSPLYYISYAVSALASLQIWDTAQTSFDDAARMYMAVLEQSAYGDGYLAVLEQSGMRTFTQPGAVADICRPVLDYMARLEDEQMG